MLPLQLNSSEYTNIDNGGNHHYLRLQANLATTFDNHLIDQSTNWSKLRATNSTFDQSSSETLDKQFKPYACYFTRNSCHSLTVDTVTCHQQPEVGGSSEISGYKKVSLSHCDSDPRQNTANVIDPPRSSKLTSASKNHRIAIIFSYLGGLIFACYITQQYLKHETTTNVYIAAPLQSELPSVSLCFFYKIPDLKKTWLVPDAGDGHTTYLTNFNLGEINSKLPNYSEFIPTCTVLDANYEPQACDKFDSQDITIKYLSLYSKCYTLFDQLDPPIIYEKKNVGSSWLLDVTLDITQITTNKVGIFLTHSTEILGDSLGNPSFLQFDTKNNNRAIVTYERTVTHKLPPPADSKCQDYSVERCKNRVSCIRQCIQETSFNKSRAWVDRRYVRLEGLTKNSDLLKGRFGLEDETSYTEECFARYFQDPCTDYMYNAIMASQFYSSLRNSTTFQINVGYPIGMETRVDYVQLLTFLDYLCFVSSVVSLWTEASMVQVCESLLDIGKGLLLRRSLSMNNSKEYQINLDPGQNRQVRDSATDRYKSKLVGQTLDSINSKANLKSRVGAKVHTSFNPTDIIGVVGVDIITKEPTFRGVYKPLHVKYNRPNYYIR